MRSAGHRKLEPNAVMERNSTVSLDPFFNAILRRRERKKKNRHRFPLLLWTYIFFVCFCFIFSRLEKGTKTLVYSVQVVTTSSRLIVTFLHGIQLREASLTYLFFVGAREQDMFVTVLMGNERGKKTNKENKTDGPLYLKKCYLKFNVYFNTL